MRDKVKYLEKTTEFMNYTVSVKEATLYTVCILLHVLTTYSVSDITATF